MRLFLGPSLTGRRKDGEITVRSNIERRLRVVRDLPWVLPASVLLELTDADLDELDLATGSRHYWRTLNAIVTRIEATKDPAEGVC
jgi:hypothetical protein